MPVSTHYNHTRGEYTHSVSCGGCDRSWEFGGSARRPQMLDSIAAQIRWLPGPGRYHSRCRSCEREYGRNRTRTPGTAPSTTIPQADRRFGVELELIFPAGCGRVRIETALAEAGCIGWRVKSDGSLHGNGWEIVSSPLKGETGMEQVRLACQALTRLGAKPNRSCGMHIHHEIRDLPLDAVKRFVRSYSNNQDLIDGLVSSSRRHSGNNIYCRRLSPGELRTVEGATDLRHIAVQRYRNVNLAAFARYGTVEIRQHQGTCDFEKVRTWILFVQAMIADAQIAPMPQQSTIRAMLDHLGAALDDTAGTFLLGRAVRFAAAPVM